MDVFIPGTSYVAKADKDGNYAITNAPVGTYKLYASKPGVGDQGTGPEGEAPADGAGGVDGPARFEEQITGLVPGPDGRLYVLDDNALRRIDLTAPGYAVTTIVRGGSDVVVVRARRPATK